MGLKRKHQMNETAQNSDKFRNGMIAFSQLSSLTEYQSPYIERGSAAAVVLSAYLVCA